MEKIIAAVDKMKPFFEKVSNNPYLRAIRDGFVSCLPVILFSSLFILVACIPEIWDFKWDDYISGLLWQAYGYSMGILVLCQDLVQHKMRNFNYFQLTNSDSLATLAL